MGRLKDQSLNLAQVREHERRLFLYMGTQLENLIFVLEELEETREQVEMMYTGTDR